LDRTFIGDFRKAELACSVNGKRLFMLSEWHAAC